MQIELTPEQRDFVHRAVAEGRLKSVEDGVREALDLWIEAERARDELLTALDEADISLARGEGIVITKNSMRDLAEDVKRRGRARLTSGKATSR